jgi:hypothetical protein
MRTVSDRLHHSFLALVALSAAALAISSTDIQFDDLKPGGQTMNWVWQSVGVDHQDNVYLIVGGARNGTLDCAWFKYNHKTGERSLIGSLREIADSYDNLGDGEIIAKGHTGIEELNGVMYTGTKGFHDARDYNTSYRGSHLFSYNITTGVADDLGRTQPDGVFQLHQGIDNVAPWPEFGKVIASSTPFFDLIIYDPQTHEAQIIEPYGSRQDNIGREIVTTPQGKVYFGCGWSNTTLKSYDITTGEVTTTNMRLSDGFINAKAQTKDRNICFISTIRGNVYKLDARSETLEHIASLPIDEHMGMALGPNDEKLFCVGSDSPYPLYEIDVATNDMSLAGDLDEAISGDWWVSGSNVRTSDGYIYFGCGKSTGSPGPSFLVKVDVRDRVTVPEPPAQAGKIAEYHLDDEGTTAVDATGNGHDGTIHGSPARTDGAVGGKAIDLDGIDDYVDLPVTLPNEGTIALWYYVDSLYNYNTVFDNSLFHNDWEMWIQGENIDESWYSCPYCWRFRLGGNEHARDVGRASYFMGNFDEDQNRQDPWQAVDRWYHAVVTWDSDGNTVLYLDGIKRDEAQSADFAAAGDHIYLGGGQENNTKGNGAIDEVIIFDTPLTASQVQTLYNGYASRTPTPPSIASAPRSVTLTENQDATFTVSASGSMPLSYQWYRDDAPVSGATTNAFTIENVSRDDNGTRVHVEVTNEHGSATSDKATLTVTDFAGVRIMQTTAAPMIDGQIDEGWSTADSHSPTTTLIGSAGADDLAAGARFLWDTDKLYALFEITDDSKNGGSTGEENYQNDGVELYIDADNSKSGSYGSDDFLYRFMWNQTDAYESKHSAIQGVELAQVDTDEGYRMEVAIPWQTLGTSPRAGALIGIDVHVNDNDGSGREGKISLFAEADDAWQNPSLFGEAKLYDTGSVSGIRTIAATATRRVLIRPAPRAIMIAGAAGARVRVYTAKGARIHDEITTSPLHHLDVPTVGYYIVSVRQGAMHTHRGVIVTNGNIR